jgi:hypothetical protein
MYCSGVTTSTAMTGSRRKRPAFLAPSWNASEPATSNACADESTSWYVPS